MSTPDPNQQDQTVTGALPPSRFDSQNAQTFGPLQVFAVHEPELLADARGNPASARALGYDTDNPHTGFITIYVELEGVKVPIERRKASGLFADFARAQATQQEVSPQVDPAQGTPPPAESQPQG